MSIEGLRKIAEEKRYNLLKSSIHLFKNNFITKHIAEEVNPSHDSSFEPWMKDPPSKKITPLHIKPEEPTEIIPKPFIIYRRVNSNRVISVIRRREFAPITVNELTKITLGEKDDVTEDSRIIVAHQRTPHHKPSLSLSSGKSISHRKTRSLHRREFTKIFETEKYYDTAGESNYKNTNIGRKAVPVYTNFSRGLNNVIEHKRNPSLLRHKENSNSLSSLNLKRNASSILAERHHFSKKASNR
ncbi:unnamed protein product [Blepharisma stoltei]|uniref:Uncharacterized protein n=1 Tax=Blepharisma stoltei TaxID=1481888 RepID=A0AAU9JEA0_9CILI|nr:unnamed protein product [Blepharisma stoltei]